ncbi:MAG: Crp/Fnr family transcriptional regulator [Spirochaetaceae bacterium]|nr:Crp/Fnr family transcriptional regulator [Spirochaetaceae bacterium]
MKNILTKHRIVLWRSRFFAGVSESDLDKLLSCLGGRRKYFEKNASIYREGDECTALGIVLSGVLHIVRDDFWGNRKIVEQVKSGEEFGTAFVCAEIKRIPVSVVAMEKSELLFLDYSHLITSCPQACPCHTQMIKNLILSLAEKNVMLLTKNDIQSKPNTREKLLAYLSAQAKMENARSFEIPFNREELAAYLSVNRSAMSAELCRLRDDGVLRFKKNKFELLKK